MSGGSSKQKQDTSSQSNSVSSNQVNPDQMSQFKNNINGVLGNASNFTSPYTGQMVAPFTPTQVQAQGAMTGVATDPTYTGDITGATNSVQGILGSLPSGTINPNPVTASTIAGTDLSPYLNPYQKNVIDTTMSQFDQMNKNELNNTHQSATAAGAFGGSRSGVADALTNQNNTVSEAPVLAGLNASNFTNAQSAAGQDAATKNAIGEFNSTQNVGAQQDSIANKLASGTLGLNAADTVANLTNAKLGTATNQAGILGEVGDKQQAQTQSSLTAAYQNWLQGKQLTAEEQSMLNQALGLMPVEQTQTGNQSGTSSSTTTQTQNPGTMGILGALGSAAMMAAMPGMGGATSLLGGILGGGGGGGTAASMQPTLPGIGGISGPLASGGYNMPSPFIPTLSMPQLQVR